MQNILWELDESKSNYGKRIPKFLGEIQSITDNDLSKTMSSITRYIEESKFLIKHMVQEDIRYFS